ncbi:hypothetical protein M2263_004277 [Providencia alcalifaciens]|nr:hypothetical protein [Providencia alcalifaciens]
MIVNNKFTVHSNSLTTSPSSPLFNTNIIRVSEKELQLSSLQKNINYHNAKELIKKFDLRGQPNTRQSVIAQNNRYFNPKTNALVLLFKSVKNYLNDPKNNELLTIVKNNFTSIIWNNLKEKEIYDFLKIYGKDWRVLNSLCESNDFKQKVIDIIIEPAISDGANWHDLVTEYQISESGPFYNGNRGVTLYQTLQSQTVDYLSEKIRNGGNCDELAQKYSIIDDKFRTIMENESIDYFAGDKVECGVLTSTEAIETCGIKIDSAISKLENISPRSNQKSPIVKAMKELTSGDRKNWNFVIKKYGIKSAKHRNNMERITCNSAKNSIRNGETAEKVISEWNIINPKLQAVLIRLESEVTLGTKASSGNLSARHAKKIISQYILPKLNIESSSSEPLKNYLNKHHVSASMVIRSLSDDNETSETILKEIKEIVYYETLETIRNMIQTAPNKMRKGNQMAIHILKLLHKNKITNLEARSNMLDYAILCMNKFFESSEKFALSINKLNIVKSNLNITN